MKRLTIVTIVLTLFYLIFSTAQAMAVSVSDFPACSNPQGTLVVGYDSGVHGIVGSTSEYKGSDKVYQVDASKTTQCFCPSDGTTGIQTDWFKAGNLSQDEVKTYEHDGWTYIPTGKIWGLSDEPYLAKNHDYTCKGTSNGTSNGVVEAASAVLGLASTGNTITLLSIASTGLVAFFLSFLLRKSK
ncbi:MAG: hypothetical protein Q8Q49_06235 [bacterium]|nr:hypothetical protein [bacterium]